MNYRDVYFARVNHHGETPGEHIRDHEIRNFKKWLACSPFTVKGLSVERGLFFEGIIEENKDKEHKKIMFLQVANDIPLLIGDILNWTLEDGTIEKWLLLQEEKKTNPSYRTFWIIKCNYLIKWVDEDGHVQQQWSYVTSSLDSMIKGNFRTWNSLITPQPNKYLEIVMPKTHIHRSVTIIIEDEAWTIVEYDSTSVQGVTYFSLTEGKVNSLTDDLVEDIADVDKIAKYELLLPEVEQIFKKGDHIIPAFTLTKNGKPSNEEIEYLSQDKSIVRVIDNIPIAINDGTTDLIIQLKGHPEIQKSISVTVGEEQQQFSAYIEGADTLKLNRKSVFTLCGIDTIVDAVTFSINDTSLATIIEVDNNKCTIIGNKENNLGTFILTATYQNQEYTKEIRIIPLW